MPNLAMEFIFDSYVVCSLMALGLGLFISALLLYHSRTDLKNLILGLIVLIFSFNLYHDLLVHSHALVHYPFIWGFGGALNPFIYVLSFLFYIYVIKGYIRSVDLTHLIIPSVYFLYRLYHRLTYDYNINNLIHYFEERPIQEIKFDAIWILSILVGIVLSIIYLILIACLLWRNPLQEQNNWNQVIALLPMMEFIFTAIIYIKIIFGFSFDEWIFGLISTISQILIFGILIIRFPIKTSQGLIQGLKYSSSNLSPEIAEEYVQKIEKVIQSESLYKKPDFSLKELAQLTGINPSYLSQCFNGNLNTSFTDYINSLRVELAKELLVDPTYDKYTVEAIALEAGFNSKSSYYRAFKKVTNLTPAQYKRQKKSSTRIN